MSTLAIFKGCYFTMMTLGITPSAELGRVDYHIQPPEYPLLLNLVFRICK
jgi:hypothetical protein